MLANNVQKAQCLTSSFYRRNIACKAPRKRNFLVCVQSRAPRSVQAVVGGGDGDGNGPRDPRICCWDENDNSGEGTGARTLQFSHGLLACVAAAAALVSWAHPATAESLNADSTDFSAYIVCDSSNMSCESDQGMRSIWLSEEEKELLDPKQYRVREWVYVH